MRPLRTAAIIAATILSAPLAADPTSDAQAISAATVTPEILAGTFDVFRPLIADAIVGQMAANGVEISDPDALVDIIIDQFGANFLQGLRDAQTAYFLENFSAEDLSAIATFYATGAGQRMIDATPELMAVGAAAGEQLGQQAFIDARQTIANRIEAEGILIESPSTLKRLIDILRQ
ncbi:MAG: DUF2059 domain-containing protein [Pseudomonadota bacterium]